MISITKYQKVFLNKMVWGIETSCIQVFMRWEELKELLVSTQTAAHSVEWGRKAFRLPLCLKKNQMTSVYTTSLYKQISVGRNGKRTIGLVVCKVLSSQGKSIKTVLLLQLKKFHLLFIGPVILPKTYFLIFQIFKDFLT